MYPQPDRRQDVACLALRAGGHSTTIRRVSVAAADVEPDLSRSSASSRASEACQRSSSLAARACLVYALKALGEASEGA